MNKHAVDLYAVLAIVKRDHHVIIGHVDIGEVVKNQFTEGKWFAYKANGERVKALDSPLAFRTRRLAVRALIEASEEVLAAAKAEYEKERGIGN